MSVEDSGEVTHSPLLVVVVLSLSLWLECPACLALCFAGKQGFTGKLHVW